MAIWVLLAKVVKALLELMKIANIAKALSSGRPIEAFIRSQISGLIMDWLEDQGVPLQSLDLRKVAADWVQSQEILGEIKEQIDPKAVGELVEIRADALDRGRYIHNSPPPTPHQLEGADPVGLVSGEFHERVEDVVLDGAGIRFSFVRTHRSRSRYTGPLGPGWDHSANLWLREEGPLVVARSTGDLREVLDVLHPLDGQTGYSYFGAESGDDSVLARDGNSFILLMPRGERIRYEAEVRPGYYHAAEILDRYGNYVRFRYQNDRLTRLEINHPQRFLALEYDPAGRIQGIADHTGRQWRYQYDEQGLLTAVIAPTTPDQPGGAITRYEYSSLFAPERYPILRVWDGEGKLRTENEYEPSRSSPDFLRVVRQVERGGEHCFAYEDLPTEKDATIEELRSVPEHLIHVYSRNGHERKLWFNRYGQLLLERDRLVEGGRIRYRHRIYRYNGDGRLVGSITPEGRITQHHYGRDEFYRDNPGPGGPVPLDDPLDQATRLGFGLELSRVSRARLFDWSTKAASALAGQDPFPDPLTVEADDMVIKWTYDRDTQEETSRSDPASTVSPDPRHVESRLPGQPGHQPGHPQFIAHQKGLTRHEYSLDSSRSLLRIYYPDITYPVPVAGLTGHADLVENFVARDTHGQLLERRDLSGARWLFSYFDATYGLLEGFLREEFKPHTDLVFDHLLPERADLRTTGAWTRDASGWTSKAGGPASLAFEFEGGAVEWHVDAFNESALGSHTGVHVELDGFPLPIWNQTAEPTRFHGGLALGKHRLEFQTVDGVSFRIGRLRTYVVVSYERDALGRTIMIRDERGFATSRMLDARDRVVCVTTPIGTSTVDHYDAEGNLVRRELDRLDEQGVAELGGPQVTQYEYDSRGNLVRYSVGAGSKRRSNRHHHNIDNLEVVRVLPRGNRVHFGYDEVMRRVWVARGACSTDISVSRRRFDLDDNEVASIDPLGRVTIKARINPDGGWSEGLDALGLERLTFYPDGGLRHRNFDKHGNISVDRHFEKRADGNWVLLAHTSFVYDPFDRPIVEVRARFKASIVTANPFAHPDEEFKQKKLLGLVEELVTRYAHDRAGRHTHTLRPDGSLTRRLFDPQGRVVLEELPNGPLTVTYYDATGNPARIDKHTSVFQPGGSAPVIREVIPRIFEYDTLGRKVGEIDGMGNRWSWFYDSRDHLRRQVDPVGNVLLTDVDGFGQVAAERMQTTDTGTGNGTPGPELIIRYAYDRNGNLIGVRDPRNQSTRLSYSSRDNLIEEVRGSGALILRVRFDRDPADNIIRRTRPGGLVERLVYDPANRLVRTDVDTSGIGLVVDALGAGAATYEEFTYDSLGRQVKHANDHCRVDIEYDSIGNAIAETIALRGPLLPAIGPFHIERHHDYAGRLLQIDYPSGRRICYRRVSGGALEAIDQMLGGANYPGHATTTDLALLAEFGQGAGRVRAAFLGNGWTWTLDVDAAGTPIRRTARHAATGAHLGMVHLHDGAGNVRAQQEELLNSGVAGGDHRIDRRLSYDSLYRLTHFQDGAPIISFNPVTFAPPSSPPQPIALTGQTTLDAMLGPLSTGPAPHTYEYDENGNRTVMREPGTPVALYDADALDRYQSINGTVRVHQSSGSLHSDRRHRFSYDHAERLLEVFDEITGGRVHGRILDAIGRPIFEQRPGGGTVLIWDDTRLIEEYQNVMPLAQHVYANQCGTPLQTATQGSELWYVEDLRGSVRLILDRNGSLMSWQHYLPFGAVTSHVVPLEDGDFGFVGHRHEVAADLIWFPHRVYNPVHGRFLQVDPAGRLDGLNPYTYACNNPGTLIDPTGLQAVSAYENPFLRTYHEAHTKADILRAQIAAMGYVPATNDWHAGEHVINAYHFTRAFSLEGALAPLIVPLVNVIGILYELKSIVWETPGGPPYELGSEGQSLVDWLWDTPGDLLANLIGSLIGAGHGDPMAAVRAAQSIPGPDHSDFENFRNPRGGGILGPPHKPGGISGFPPGMASPQIVWSGIKDIGGGFKTIFTIPVTVFEAKNAWEVVGTVLGDPISGVGEILSGVVEVTFGSLGVLIGHGWIWGD